MTTGSRDSRILGAATAALITALIVAACGGTASTPKSSPVSPSPSGAESAEPTALPSGEFAAEAAAIALVEALGGTVPAGTTAAITYGDSMAGSSSVHVALGEWQMAWDSKRVLRHVFWEQSGDGTTPPPSSVLSETQIRERADVLIRALWLEIGAPKELAEQVDAWIAAWPRDVDGVPAEENGTRLWLNKDGSFLQYTFGWNDLAPRPASTITADQAIEAAEDCGGLTGPSATCEAKLVWHLPSAGAMDAPLILCWMVGPKGGGGDWRVWVDAGTGQIVDVAAMLD